MRVSPTYSKKRNHVVVNVTLLRYPWGCLFNSADTESAGHILMNGKQITNEQYISPLITKPEGNDGASLAHNPLNVIAGRLLIFIDMPQRAAKTSKLFLEK